MEPDKTQIRRHIKTLKATLSEADRLAQAESVFATLEKTPAFISAQRILVYHALPDELPTARFMEKWHERKQLFLPRVNGDSLDILPFDSSSLHLGAFNIQEPSGDDLIDPATLDLIIVPGVAFDTKGGRLGRGRGYYDRLLSRTNATRVGVAYDLQLVEHIPTEPHDLPINHLITPTHHLHFTTSK